MSKIPKDVAEQARQTWNKIMNNGYRDGSILISQAILAEREACAKIAEGNAKGFDFQRALADGDDMEVGAKSVQLAISDAIRRR